jgi:hypothetical protein
MKPPKEIFERAQALAETWFDPKKLVTSTLAAQLVLAKCVVTLREAGNSEQLKKFFARHGLCLEHASSQELNACAAAAAAMGTSVSDPIQATVYLLMQSITAASGDFTSAVAVLHAAALTLSQKFGEPDVDLVVGLSQATTERLNKLGWENIRSVQPFFMSRGGDA